MAFKFIKIKTDLKFDININKIVINYFFVCFSL